MKTIALLCLSGGLLFAAATPANASPSERYDYVPPGHYEARIERPHQMPRWLRQERSFRYWYRESPHRYRRALSWTRLYDIYGQERHYVRRDSNVHYGRDRNYDSRRHYPRRRH